MMIRMVAAKPLKYGSQRLEVGDVFFARGRRDAKLLIAIGKAFEAPETQTQPMTNMYQTRALTAAQPTVTIEPIFIKVDGFPTRIDDKNRDELRELTDRLGVKVHHLAGEAKLRQALVDAQTE